VELRNRSSCDSKAQPFNPFAEIVGIRDILVQQPVGYGIMLGGTFLSFAVVLFDLSLRFGLPSNIKQNLVVDDIPSETQCPGGQAKIEQRAGVGISEKGMGRRGGQVSSHEGAIYDVKEDGREGDGDMRF